MNGLSREYLKRLVEEPVGSYMTVITFDPAVGGMVEFIMAKINDKEWRGHRKSITASGKGWHPVPSRDLAIALEEYAALWWCS